jgi:hypothetical protein
MMLTFQKGIKTFGPMAQKTIWLIAFRMPAKLFGIVKLAAQLARSGDNRASVLLAMKELSGQSYAQLVTRLHVDVLERANLKAS